MKEKPDKKKHLHRIKIIEGHLKAIEKMIENDEYCLNIIHQSLAVQKALKQLDLKLMENHLRHCVVEQAKNGQEEQLTKELIDIYCYK
jgi:CsoR family transcriptional regulator, copper-sensing transcriptional repressor